MSPLYTKNPDVILREETEDAGLFFNPDTNQIRVLNSTALRIWQLCDGQRDISAIVADLQQIFDDVPSDANLRDEVGLFLNEMLEVGLIGIVES